MLSTLKRMALAAIDPRYEEKERELANLRAAAQQHGGIQPNSWRRILGADGGLLGFDFYCCQSYQLRDITLWLRTHTCPQCKTSFSVFEACGIKPGTPPGDGRVNSGPCRCSRNLPCRRRAHLGYVGGGRG